MACIAPQTLMYVKLSHVFPRVIGDATGGLLADANDVPTTLFLHGGPGLSAIAERTRLVMPCPVDWWEQPRAHEGQTAPYACLLREAEQKFTSMCAASAAPIRLLASSFGCMLARHLAARFPDAISVIVLLAPTFDPQASYRRFAATLLDTSPSPALHAAYESCKSNSATAAFWDLVAAILATPRFSDSYWSVGAMPARRQFAALMADSAGFDFPTYRLVLDDFLTTPPPSGPSPYRGPVTVTVGASDPYATLERTRAEVHRYFPQAQLSLVDAGHFPHLELAPEFWLPHDFAEQ